MHLPHTFDIGSEWKIELVAKCNVDGLIVAYAGVLVGACRQGSTVDLLAVTAYLGYGTDV